MTTVKHKHKPSMNIPRCKLTFYNLRHKANSTKNYESMFLRVVKILNFQIAPWSINLRFRVYPTRQELFFTLQKISKSFNTIFCLYN